MGYSKITALSLTDLFVQQIENMILSGELAFGEQLPPARELAAKMGVSRTVVTAGLVELEKLGFVEIKARQGVYVCDYRRRGTMETLVAIMRYNGGALRQNEVRSLLETRDAMECMCMRLVVERSDTASLEALAPVLESIRTARDSDEAAENVFLFHHELAVLSGNVLMPLLYHSFRPQSVYLWTIDCKRSGIQKMYESKLALYTALLNGDAPTAVRIKMFPAFLPGKRGTFTQGRFFHRSFLSSSSPEYGIARLPQPVPMEMCVLRVPWQSLPPEMPMPYVPAADGCIHIFFI